MLTSEKTEGDQHRQSTGAPLAMQAAPLPTEAAVRRQEPPGLAWRVSWGDDATLQVAAPAVHAQLDERASKGRQRRVVAGASMCASMDDPVPLNLCTGVSGRGRHAPAARRGHYVLAMPEGCALRGEAGVDVWTFYEEPDDGHEANAVLHATYVPVPGVGVSDGHELIVPLVLLVRPVEAGGSITLCYNNPLFGRDYTPGRAPRRAPRFGPEDTLAFVSSLNPDVDVLAALSAMYVSLSLIHI